MEKIKLARIASTFTLAMDVLGVNHGERFGPEGEGNVGTFVLLIDYEDDTFNIGKVVTKDGHVILPFSSWAQAYDYLEFMALLDGIMGACFIQQAARDKFMSDLQTATEDQDAR